MFNNLFELETFCEGLDSSGFSGKSEMELVEAIKLLIKKVNSLEAQLTNLQTDFSSFYSENYEVHERLDEQRDLIKKMGKDFPELVLSNPNFYKN